MTLSTATFVQSVVAGEDGRFAMEDVPPGRYDFRITAPGYAVFEAPVVVRSGDAQKNWMEIKNLLPATQQTVSVSDLAGKSQTRGRWRRAVSTLSRSGA